MNEKRLIAIWFVAMVILASVYYYWDRHRGSSLPGKTNAAAVVDDSEPTLPVGSAMIPLPGTWLDGAKPEFKGKVVVLDFWGTFCQPCLASIPSNNRFFKNYGAKGVTFVGVARDNQSMLADFKKARGIDYPLLSTDNETFSAYGIQAIPSTFLFDKQGKLVWKGNQFEQPNGEFVAAFKDALKAAMDEADPKGVAAEEKVELPPEFVKLIEKANAEKANPAAPEPEPGLKIGAPLPALKGEWIGTPIPDLKNKVVIMDFWTTSCGACIESIPGCNAFNEKHAPQGVFFFGPTPEAKDLVEKFRTKREMRYPVLAQCEELFDICAIKELPTVLMFGKDGKLVWKGDHVVDKGKVNEELEKALAAALK